MPSQLGQFDATSTSLLGNIIDYSRMNKVEIIRQPVMKKASPGPFQWNSPEPKVIVQRLPVTMNWGSGHAPRVSPIPQPGWGNGDVFPKWGRGVTEGGSTRAPCPQKRVRRRLLPETSTPIHPSTHHNESEPLAVLLDDQLFPEIGSSGDHFLKSPPNVDYVLGSVTPKRTADWDPEEVLKSHGIDIFGNQDHREEFINICETLLVQPSTDTPCSSRSARYSDSPLWGGNEHYWNRSAIARRRLAQQSPFSPDYPSSQYLDSGDSSLYMSDSQSSSIYSSPGSMYSQDSQPCKRRRGLGLTVCEALYYDGERYVNVKAITDGTMKYKLVMPKSHRHRRGMPEDVPIFTAVIEE